MPKFNRTIRQWAKQYGTQQLMPFTAADGDQVIKEVGAITRQRAEKNLREVAGTCRLRRNQWLRGHQTIPPYCVLEVRRPEENAAMWTLRLVSALYQNTTDQAAHEFEVHSDGVDMIGRARFPHGDGRFTGPIDRPPVVDVKAWREAAGVVVKRQPKPPATLKDHVAHQLKCWKIPYFDIDEAKKVIYGGQKLRSFHFSVKAEQGMNWLLIVSQVERKQREDMREWVKIFGPDHIAVAAKRSNTDGSIIYTHLLFDKPKGTKDPVVKLEALAPAGVDTLAPLPPLNPVARRKPAKRGREVVITAHDASGGTDEALNAQVRERVNKYPIVEDHPDAHGEDFPEL